MSLTNARSQPGNFVFSSSIAGDIWHPGKDQKAYEWWYFDALSDDGRDAVVILFLDDLVYSPEYNRASAASAGRDRFPAVAFTYFRDGKPAYRSVMQFPQSSFSADSDKPGARIGGSSFNYGKAAYGSGFDIEIDVPLSGDRRIRAAFEWLSIESDYLEEATCPPNNSHCWNMVAPRCDVSGKITILDKHGTESDVFKFRGTGYHDHKLDNRWFAKTVQDWHWGRAHFAGLTAVFHKYQETGEENGRSQLMMIEDARLSIHDAVLEGRGFTRDKLGIKFPKEITVKAEDGSVLTSRAKSVIDSSFFHVRFVTEMTLAGRDGHERTTHGISEYIHPHALKYPGVARLGSLLTGRNGKGRIIG